MKNILESWSAVTKLITGTAAAVAVLWSIFALADQIKENSENYEELKDYTVTNFQMLRLDELNEKIRAIEVIPEDRREAWQSEQLLLLRDQKDKLLLEIKK